MECVPGGLAGVRFMPVQDNRGLNRRGLQSPVTGKCMGLSQLAEIKSVAAAVVTIDPPADILIYPQRH